MSAESRLAELEITGVRSINSNGQTPRSRDNGQAQPSRHENGASGAYSACLSCRITKQKCDGMRPCSNCAASHVVCDQSALSPPAVRSLPSSMSRRSHPEGLFDNSTEDEEGLIEARIRRKRRRIVESRSRKDQSKSQIFVCPFYSHDPAKYNRNVDKRYKTCSQGFRGIPRLKEHLKRNHFVQSMCPRCHEKFSSEVDLESHLKRVETCPVKSTRPEVDCITREQENILRQRSRTAKTDEEKWAQIYNILYPDELIPSPYNDTLDTNTTQNFSPLTDERLFKRLDGSIQSIIRREASYLSDTATTQLVNSLVGGVEEAMKEHVEEVLSSLGIAMPGIPATKKDGSSRPLNNGVASANIDEWSIFSSGETVLDTSLSRASMNIDHTNNHSDTAEASSAQTVLNTTSPSATSRTLWNRQESLASSAAQVSRSADLINAGENLKPHENLSRTRDRPFSPHFNEISSSSVEQTKSSLECNMCGATFRIPSELRKHALMHKRPYKCEIRGCLRNEGFSTTSDLERHQKAVHNVTSSHDVFWRCASVGCNYSSPRRDNFRQHLARMHPHEDERALIQRSESRVEHANVDIS